MAKSILCVLLWLLTSGVAIAEVKLPQTDVPVTVSYYASAGVPSEKASLEPRGSMRPIYRNNAYNLTVAVSWEAMNEEIIAPLDKQFRVAQSFLVPNLNSGPIVAAGGSHIFTPTSLKFMAASGCNDANNGLTTSAPWCTTNHAMNAGDVILANAGTYNGSMNTWGAVSNTPSTTGGIDGIGGITTAILLCAASDIEGCVINCATASCAAGHVGSGGRSAPPAAMNVNSSYWAISGWSAFGNGTTAAGYQIDSCLTQTTIIHHVAVINSKIVNSNQGWAANDCAYNHNIPGNGGDYATALGLIAQASSQNSICLSAVDFVGPASIDANAGTHTYINTSYIWNSQSPSCVSVSDSEAIMLDTLDAHSYSGKIVVSNNMGWLSMRNCIQVFYQNFNSTTTPINISNNTCYDNLTNMGNDFSQGEINLSGTGAAVPLVPTVQNNIALTARTTSGSGANPRTVYAMVTGGGLWSTLTNGGSGNQNILFAPGQTVCTSGTCDSTKSEEVFNSNPLGTNTYVNPNFANTTDLLANWSGAPTCTGFVTTTACMGWDANTGTLTTLTPISDLTPTASGGLPGKGFQYPSTTCAPNSNYPVWIKGLNVLRASGWTNSAVITEYPDLATKPCGT